ncbi:MAG TPA: ABC transporter permease [Phycisphaerales bacterium]|nr:ABC transporter permease [Phycisphaerales bacterium]
MSKTLMVARREFLATVLTKGFLLGILLPPIIMAVALTLVPLLMNAAAPKTTGTIAVIDRSGLVEDALRVSLNSDAFQARRAKKMEKAQQKIRSGGINLPSDPRAEAIQKNLASGGPSLSVIILPRDADPEKEKQPILSARVRDGDDASRSQRVALVVIPEGAVRMPAPVGADKEPAFEHYQLLTAPKLDIEVQQDISEEVDHAIVDARLTAASLDPKAVRQLTTTPVTDTLVITPEGERTDNPVTAMLLPAGFMILLWISVLVGGQGLLMSTVEEKSSRVMEVLLSAVSPMQLMVGKILGQMGVAAAIMSLYSLSGIGALVFFSQSHLLDPMLLVYTAIYFVIAFFLMASMMAAIGSAVNDIREAQMLMQPIMIVMVIPMVLWLPISRNPNGMFAQITSFVPPISPFVMVVRLAGSEKIPFWQVPVSIAIGVASMIFMAWAAAKIFRIGVLMYGKPPNLKTLIRWVRMA